MGDVFIRQRIPLVRHCSALNWIRKRKKIGVVLSFERLGTFEVPIEIGLLGNATAVKRGVGQSQKEPCQPPKSDPGTPPSCHHSRKFPPHSPGPAQQARPTSSPCWDLPLPIPPTPLLSQQLRLDFYFHLLNECFSSFQRELPWAGSTGRWQVLLLLEIRPLVWLRLGAGGCQRSMPI